MGTKTKFYIVAADALPEIFIRVAEAKRMLQTGEADTVGAATRQVGISRSAFYKYKDAVQPFNDMKVGHIITFYAMLKDNPGVLSNVLSIFAGSGANILTINQNIPADGVAPVSVTIRIDETDGLLPGMSVDATIELASAEDVLAIPSAALNRGDTVLVTADSPSAANGTLVESTTEDGEDYYSVEVTTGVSGDDYIEIVSGLQEGDTVVYIPTSSSSSEMGMMMGGMPGGMGGGMPSGGGGMPGGGGGMGGGPGF